MINKETAKKIDESTHFHGISVENRIKQLDEEAEQLVTIIPKIFVRNMRLNSELNAKINKTKSQLTVKVESMINDNEKLYTSSDNTKVRTPSPNKRILVGGTMRNNKFLEGLSFIPEKDEGITLYSEEFKKLVNESNIKPSSLTIDPASEKIEYNAQAENKLLDTLSISENKNYDFTNRRDQARRFHQYLNDKYVVYPYKVTETWNLAIDINESTEGMKTTNTSHDLAISYYVMVLGYKDNYLFDKLNGQEVLGEIATLGKANNRDVVTKLGRSYQDTIMTNITIDINVTGELATQQTSNISLLPNMDKKEDDYSIWIEEDIDTKSLSLEDYDIYKITLVPVLK